MFGRKQSVKQMNDSQVKTSMQSGTEDYYITAGTQPHPDTGPLQRRKHKLDLRLISEVCFGFSGIFFLSSLFGRKRIWVEQMLKRKPKSEILCWDFSQIWII